MSQIEQIVFVKSILYVKKNYQKMDFLFIFLKHIKCGCNKKDALQNKCTDYDR